MIRFMKVTVATDGYQQIKQIGDRYVVHLEPTVNGEETECYEYIVDEEPNIEYLTSQLQEWKQYISARQLEFAKVDKCKQLIEYDSSSSVNSFTINNKSMWIDASLRQQLRISLEAIQAAGRDTATKWFDGVEYTFPLTSWFSMLNALEVYAADALNVTESHKAAINNLTSIEDVEAYDFTVGYPQKLNF